MRERQMECSGEIRSPGDEHGLHVRSPSLLDRALRLARSPWIHVERVAARPMPATIRYQRRDIYRMSDPRLA